MAEPRSFCHRAKSHAFASQVPALYAFQSVGDAEFSSPGSAYGFCPVPKKLCKIPTKEVRARIEKDVVPFMKLEQRSTNIPEAYIESDNVDDIINTSSTTNEETIQCCGNIFVETENPLDDDFDVDEEECFPSLSDESTSAFGDDEDSAYTASEENSCDLESRSSTPDYFPFVSSMKSSEFPPLHECLLSCESASSEESCSKPLSKGARKAFNRKTKWRVLGNAIVTEGESGYTSELSANCSTADCEVESHYSESTTIRNYSAVVANKALKTDSETEVISLLETSLLSEDTAARYDVLTEQICDVYERATQTEATLVKKLRLRDMLYYQLSTIFPVCGLYIVGSSLNGFGNENSDMDLCLIITTCELNQRTDAVQVLKMVENTLTALSVVREQHLIPAKVPILRIKFKGAFKDFTVDLNANNSVAIRNTHLLCYYAFFDWRLRPLTAIVKEWAKRCNINDASRSSFTSYSLVLMVIHYLQVGAERPVLPSLQQLFPRRFSTKNDIRTLNVSIPLEDIPPGSNFERNEDATLGELLIGFFHYYASVYDFEKDALLVAFFYNVFGSEAECPPGAVVSPHDPNVCYLLSPNATDYYSAADYCEKVGGNLASVHGAFENNYFIGAASSSGTDSFWIGGNNNNLNGTWKWEDGSAFDWVDWGIGQPNGTAGLCLSVNTNNGYWYGEGCIQSKPFMCQVNPSKQGAASCPNGWSFYSKTKNCYKALKNTTGLTCSSAFQRCGALNATVVSIHSFGENSFVAGMTMMTNYNIRAVIGLIADKTNWRWQDNTNYNYSRWDGTYQPQNTTCVVLQSFNNREKWYATSSDPSAVVCELNGYENSRSILLDSACPKGTVANPDNVNICYKIYSDAANWYAAEQSCLKGNGHLASVHNSDENALLLGIVPFSVPGAVDFWTGGSFNSTWKWSDGSFFDFSNWAPGNPQSDSSLCLSEKVRSGFWYSTKCDDAKPYVCTVPSTNVQRPSCPPNFSYYDATNKCYQVIQTNEPIKSCDYAQSLCFNLSSQVASIHSDEENYFIAGLAMNDISNQFIQTAIGLVGDGYGWNWLDGTFVDYNNWYIYKSPEKNSCGVMFTSFYRYIAQWSTLSSEGSYTQVVCQVKAT